MRKLIDERSHRYFFSFLILLIQCISKFIENCFPVRIQKITLLTETSDYIF